MDKGNSIDLNSIGELLGMSFFIPSYQRGYRWDKQQVKDLLGDIYDFATKKNKTQEEFYCLQPIVVKECSPEDIKRNNLKSKLNNDKWYEVIDGQQRLTTIRIILSYIVKEMYPGKSLFDKHKKHPFEIEYETRKNTNSFLDNIERNSDEIDLYYISEAYSTIKTWFEELKDDPQIAQEAIRNTLINTEKDQDKGTVQVIWYEITNDVNPIEIFTRINMGKIPLTNAELIKALFLQKRNFGNDDIAELRQIEISKEWDEMEYALQEDDFWGYLNKNENTIPARIEFLFDLIRNVAKQEDKDFDEKYGTDKDVTFRYFNTKFTEKDKSFNVLEDIWEKVKDYFNALKEWFYSPVWYHYTGFLIYCGVDILEIYNLYKGKTKKEFTESLIGRIRKEFSCKEESKYEKSGEQYKFDLSYKDNEDKGIIRKLLLLFNIEFIVQQHEEIMDENKEEDEDYFIIKFPFELFKKEKWDIEHIDPQTPNPEDQIQWLKTEKEDLKDEINKDPKLSADIENFIQNEKLNEDKFKDLCSRISSLKQNDSIGNLTLLNADINRSYGNSQFQTKRNVIIVKDMEGKFIPICTKHVFLKYFDKEGTSRTEWGKEDIQNYQNHIGHILEKKKFLTFKPIEKHE